MHPQQVGIVMGGDDDLATKSILIIIMISIYLHFKPMFQQMCMKRVLQNIPETFKAEAGDG